jgi:DNA-binding MarR family transcriptional regulator
MLSAGHVRELDGHADSEKLASEIATRKLNVMEARNLIKTSRHPVQETKDFSEITNVLSEKWGAKVAVDSNKAQVTIRCDDIEALDSLLEQLASR